VAKILILYKIDANLLVFNNILKVRSDLFSKWG